MILLVLSIVCSSAASAAESADPPPPRLVLYVVIDQMPYDYVERFRPVLTGGLGRLLDEGVVFTRAFHRHALPTTAPGHATLATGLHPRHHGIIANWWWDRERREEVYCVEDAEERTGPYHLLAPALGDWLRARDPESRVFTASPKNRAAVLLGGLGADGAYWYDDDTGTFESDEYYRQAEPEWLAELAAERWVDRYFGKAWEPLAAPDEMPAGFDLEDLGVLDLDTGVFDRTFPHALGRSRTAPTESFYDAVYDSPFVDELLVELVRRMVEAEGLGADEHTDLLGVSFSSLDTVGHDYGPNSPEILDAVRRIDRGLGRLLGLLETRVGRNRLVVALSADHGVMPLPEYERLQGRDAHREDAGDVACIQGVFGRLGGELGGSAGSTGWGPWLAYPGYLNPEAIAASGHAREDVERRAREILEACPTVERVWTRSELEGPLPERDDLPAGSMAALYRNAFHPERSPDLLIQRKPYRLDDPVPGTTHLSPYPFDTHVPMIVRVPGLEPARVDRPVATVDLAPTVAALVGIPVPEDLDGEDLLGGRPVPPQ
jgi:predicted AlkP superfamily pyrophosphatase or phosphodiesterase